VVACVLIREPNGDLSTPIRRGETRTSDRLELVAWFQEQGREHVAMERTGVDGKPLYQLLDGHVPVMMVNAQHVSQVSGLTIEIKDAELCPHTGATRDVRDLTRSRHS
jgi:transposase